MTTPSVASYSVGKRVYNGGTDAPTRGTVDPLGYITRELTSQSRSGLAQAALAKLRGNTQMPQQPGVQVPDTMQSQSQQFPGTQRILTTDPTGHHMFIDPPPPMAMPSDPLGLSSSGIMPGTSEGLPGAAQAALGGMLGG